MSPVIFIIAVICMLIISTVAYAGARYDLICVNDQDWYNQLKTIEVKYFAKYPIIELDKKIINLNKKNKLLHLIRKFPVL